MTEPTETIEETQLEWTSLGDAFRRKFSSGAIATSIESDGIFGWDRFGRWREVTKGSEDWKRVMDVCASVHEYTSSVPGDEDEHPMEAWAGDPNDPFGLFGWPNESLPIFKEEPAGPARPKRESAAGATKTRDSLLVMIAGLLRHSNLIADDYKVTALITGMVQRAGLKIGEDTVRNVLAEIPGAEKRRKSKQLKPNSG